MKNTLFSFVVLVSTMLWSAAAWSQDDVYYYPSTNNNPSTTQQQTDQSGNTYITNNYYDNDEYVNYEEDEYDYYYSSRIRRFHSPYAGFNYYGGYYTDRYWYGVQDPFGGVTASMTILGHGNR